MKPGRNQPCPCGSGKKYKHCCLVAETATSDSPRELAWRRLDRAIYGYAQTMIPFIDDVYRPGIVNEAWAEFTLGEEDSCDTQSPHLSVFFPWLFHHWMPDAMEGTIIEDKSLHLRAPTTVFLERRGSRVDPLLRRYLQACAESPFTFLEVRQCIPGQGFLARDLFTGEEREVRERLESSDLEAGDILFCQPVCIDDFTVTEGRAELPFPPGVKPDILELRERMLPEQGPLATGLVRERLRHWDMEVRELYFELMEETPSLIAEEVRNTDNEPVVPQRVVFDIDDARIAFDALRHLELQESEADLLARAERDAGGRIARIGFTWKKPGNRIHESWTNTILGYLTITATSLTAEVNSNERAQVFRDIVENALGTHARFRAVEVIPHAAPSAEQLRAADEESAGLAEIPEIRESVQKFLAAHYESWPSRNVPALGGRTPLKAVKSAEGRAQVEAIIAGIELAAPRMRSPPDPVIFLRLRERLGLSKPGASA